MAFLSHPLTGQVIEVPDNSAEQWREAGWLDSQPSDTDDTQEVD